MRQFFYVLVACLVLAGCSDDGFLSLPEEDLPKELPKEMASFRGVVESSQLDYVKVNAKLTNNTKPWESKLRGDPYLPKGSAYPKDVDGVPMVLLAQINFAEVPKLADYPDRGILQFFVASVETSKQIWGLEFYAAKPWVEKDYFNSLKQQNYFKVVYYPDVTHDLSKLQSNFPAFPELNLPITQQARLSFTKSREYVLVYDYRFKKYFGKDAYEFFEQFGDRASKVADQYSHYTEELMLGKIGGYAAFTQEDPRKSAAKNEDWLLLFQSDSFSQSDGLDILWGDAGVGNFHIKRDALRKQDFSEVLYYWDNH